MLCSGYLGGGGDLDGDRLERLAVCFVIERIWDGDKSVTSCSVEVLAG